MSIAYKGKLLLAVLLLLVAGCAASTNGIFEREADLHYYRAVEYSRGGRHAEALAEFREAIRLAPDNPDLYRGAGLSLSRLGRTEEAVAEYSTAVRLDSRNAGALMDLGGAQAALGRWEDAAKSYSSAASIGTVESGLKLVARKNLSVVLDTLGEVAFEAGDYDKAIGYYDRSLTEGQGSVASYMGRARARWMKGAHDAALSDYDAALERAPSMPAINLERGLSLYQIGRTEEGARDINRALWVEPSMMVEVAAMGRASDIPILIENGAKIDARDHAGNTAIMAAAAGAHADAIEVLLNKGADALAPDKSGRTPLMLASASGKGADGVRSIKLLLDAGADVNKRATNGETALMMAAASGGTGVVAALLDAGADGGTRGLSGATPILYAAKNGRADVVELLARRGVDVNARDVNDISSMGYAALAGYADVIGVLAAAGAEVDVRDHMGETPLMWAVLKGHVGAARALLDAGANEDARTIRGVSPLMIAAGNGHAVLTEMILAETVRVKARDNRNASALLRAEAFGYADIVKTLKAAGATEGRYPSVNAIVYGRVVFVEDGEPKVPYGGTLSRPALSFVQLESGSRVQVLQGSEAEVRKMVHLKDVDPGLSGQEKTGGVDAEAIGFMTRVEPDGSFFWRLPRGTYVIPEIRYAYSVIPKVVFQVPYEGDAIYLGTLMVHVTTDKVAGNRLLKEIDSVEVREEYYSARAELFSRFGDKEGNFTGEIVKSLMKHSPAIPESAGALTPLLANEALKEVGINLLLEIEPGTF